MLNNSKYIVIVRQHLKNIYHRRHFLRIKKLFLNNCNSLKWYSNLLNIRRYFFFVFKNIIGKNNKLLRLIFLCIPEIGFKDKRKKHKRKRREKSRRKKNETELQREKKRRKRKRRKIIPIFAESDFIQIST